MKLALHILLAFAAMPAAALTLADCDRVTHAFHGGENGHRDLGHGRVLYANWWSQEAVLTDLILADCARGQALTVRTREEGVARLPFDRTQKALAVIETELGASPALFSLDRLARALQPLGRDIRVADLVSEPCACAALYPEHQGNTHSFELDQ